MKLKDKVALVTGGSSGIGTAISVLFAKEGAKVAVVASSDLKKAQAVVDEIAAAGGSAQAFTADITKASNVEALVKKVKDAFGGIDVLVNSAGVFYPTPAGETKAADGDRMIDINLRGLFYMINAVVPLLKERGGGKIVNMSSVAGVMGFGNYAIYCATKAGVAHMTKALALELAPSGINVNAIAPGNTATPMNEDIRTDPELKPVYDYMASRTPSGRTYSEAEEMAGIALLLASEDGRALHGATIVADEGLSAGL